jgi:hypothetical protein
MWSAGATHFLHSLTPSLARCTFYTLHTNYILTSLLLYSILPYSTVTMEAERVAHIRELEVQVLQDLKNSNSILEIKRNFLDSDNHQKVRLAALHSLR